ncbi:TPA: AAA family ATPase [Pasteurella multocida]|nr:AAA family ATPase [Pasteurella multocida]HDR1505688.1 AAA family ATPase [Pasteurella multocida]HDR1586287.1 AAA family ATPase [Pasteurella multocida]HDR1913035.1 AAA family ATPase [Pasteurella multocida]
MSIATLILGESGTGKSTSLRDLDPDKVLLIQSIHKPLPFRSTNWTLCNKENPTGSIFITDQSETICKAMERTQKDIIVIDDFQYIMANEFMRRSREKSYDKFTDIGRNAWDIFEKATTLPSHKRVYILAHTQTDEYGRTKIKTIGKMLDEKITLEGMVTICLRTQVTDGKYFFTTQNNGQDTVKSPMGLFPEQVIDNSLDLVDDYIRDYYGINSAAKQEGN